MRLSTVEVWARVSDSVQPVHSWNDSQITYGRMAFSSAAAMAGTMLGGNAIIEAVAAQNFRNPRRVIPCRRRASPKVSSFDIIYLLCAVTSLMCCFRQLCLQLFKAQLDIRLL